MKRNSSMVILVVSPLLMAALWMDHQPSFKAYQSPVLVTPVGSVPVSGKETADLQPRMANPVPSGASSLAQGKTLFEINCVLCHGKTSAKPGPVGQKFMPPPPGLDHVMVLELSESDIFKAITSGFGRMPPFRDKLTLTERWNLVNFLRTRK